MPKFFKSLHFRLGFLYALAFTVSTLILGVVIVFTTQEFLEQQLQDHAQYAANQLLNDYYQDGIDELRHDIRERVESEHPDRLWYFLQDPNGKMEFDDLHQPWPTHPGWHPIKILNREFLLLSIHLKEGFKLGIAVELESVEAAGIALRNAFVIVTILTLLLSAFGGFFISRAFLNRLEKLKGTISSIGQDDLHLRVPVTQGGDEFDQLSKMINGMLSRIETLVREVQGVSANIAHDLRTPLGRMKQKLESLQEAASLNAQDKEKLHEISEILDETLNTFAAILRIAEVHSGTRRSEFKNLTVQQLFEKVANAYEAVVEDSERSVSFKCPDVTTQPLNLFGDISLLTQLLANLIENALQHTPPGTHLHIEARQQQGQVLLAISDNGPGIVEEERHAIVQPFFKLDRSRNSKGSGLGLSLVSAIAKLHNADLEIKDNHPGLRIEILFK